MSLRSSPVLRALTKDKTVKSKLLNRMGIQVARTIGARCIYKMRPVPVSDSVRGYVDEIKREGMVLLPNFLPPAQFEALKQESLRLLNENPDKVVGKFQGPTRHEAAMVTDDFPKSSFPNIYKFYDDPRLRGIMSAAEKRSISEANSYYAIERLTQGPMDEQVDPETILHSDIFFNTHKAWLYLDDITLEQGPLVYVKGSNRLRALQLSGVYKESCDINTGSRRVEKEELDKLGLEETVVLCPKNTLVIANTFGYHRRLRGAPGVQRHSVHMMLRSHPFVFWR
jgi:hypothetical protein